MSGAVLDALVIGGGPAGLATSRELQRLGIRHEVLERGDQAGFTWAHLYDSLTLHTGKHMSHLPGWRYPASTPLWLSRQHFVQYLHEYAARFALPLRTGVMVHRLQRERGGWIAETSNGPVHAKALVVATGIISAPRIPDIPGREQFRGEVLHSSEYRRPAPFIGKRVLLVGVGNSGGEIGAELARAGAYVTVSVRSGAHVVPRDIAGIPIQYIVFLMRRFPRSVRLRIAALVQKISEKRRGPAVLPRPAHSALDAIPLIGFALPDVIRQGLVPVRPGLDAFTPTGVRFTDGRSEDFDVVMLATGFTPATQELLGDLITRDAKGFARRTDRVTSADQAGLFFVGHNYDAAGGISNIRTDAPLAAAGVAAALRRTAG